MYIIYTSTVLSVLYILAVIGTSFAEPVLMRSAPDTGSGFRCKSGVKNIFLILVIDVKKSTKYLVLSVGIQKPGDVRVFLLLSLKH